MSSDAGSGVEALSDEVLSGQRRDRLEFRANPVRQLFSPAPLAALGYLLSYPVVGAALFAISLVTPVIAAIASVTWIGLPLLVLAAWAVRGCAEFERIRYALVGPRLRGDYVVSSGGVMDAARRAWTDATTWRDIGYLVGLFLPLLLLDLIAVLGWLILLALFSSLAWFWAIPQTFDDGTSSHGITLGYLPDGPHGDRGFGIWIGSVPAALGAAVLAVLLALGFSYLLIAAARLHRYAARTMLGPRVDPLAQARAVLAREQTSLAV